MFFARHPGQLAPAHGLETALRAQLQEEAGETSTACVTLEPMTASGRVRTRHREMRLVNTITADYFPCEAVTNFTLHIQQANLLPRQRLKIQDLTSE